MGHLIVYLGDLPEAPVDAAAQFASKHAREAREWLLQGGWRSMGLAEEPDALTYVFPAGGKVHEGWQRAMIQAMAREVAPKRVNGVIGDGLASTDEVTDWLGDAPGVTGQLFAVEC
jgi:hypothetical protein